MRRVFLITSVALGSFTLTCGAALQFKPVASPVSANLAAATCDTNLTFVAVGTNSSVLTGKFATDHVTWSSNGAPISISLLSATFGNNIFLAGGTGGNVVSSANGLTWGSPTAPFTNFTAYIMGLAFNPRIGISPRFVAAPALFEVASSPASLPLAWSGANMDQYSLGESWRAVAPFGANGFVACGYQGDIRYSTNGGTTWYISRVPNSAFADLNGIASDGDNRLVAVGAAGTILYSGNGGTSWSAATAPAAGTNLTAVTWDAADQLFFAVGTSASGSSGAVLASANGTTWTNVNSGYSNPLRGVTFANNGSLTGVGFFVGDAGRAWLAGTPPAAAITNILSSVTNCSFTLPNPALTASIVSDVAHPAGSVGIDWYNSAGQRVGINSTSFAPTDTFAPANGTATYLYYAVTRDLRTDITNATPVPVTLTLYPRPTAAVTGSTTICNGGSTTVAASLTGVAPWTVVWASNGIPITTHSGLLTPADTLQVSPVDPYLNAFTNVLYTVASVVDFYGCSAFDTNLTGGALIRINPRPTATVTGTNTICNGQATLVSAALTGLGPWNVTWSSNGVVVATHLSVGTTVDTLTVSPRDDNPNWWTNALYQVSAITDASTGCTDNHSTDLQGGALITINPRPTAYVTGTNAICNGDATIVHAALTGIGPWNVTWSSNGVVVTTHLNVPTPQDTLTVSPRDDNPNWWTNALYRVSAITDASTGCADNQTTDLTGGALITINPRPTASVTGTNTICNGDSTIVHAALTGLGPWNVTWSSNGVVVATHLSVGPPSDSLTVSPRDDNPNWWTNALYRVSAITDVNTGCTNNQPGDLTGGALITVNPRPTANVTGSATICNGQSTTVSAALTGLGPWNITWSSNGVVVATHSNVATATDTLTVSPRDDNPNWWTNALYQVSAITDVNTGCTNNQPGDLTGGALITINPRPTAAVSGTNTICNGQSTTVLAALTGLGPWNVTWSSNGVAVATHANVGIPSDTLTVSPRDDDPNGSTNALYRVSAITDVNTGCTNNQPTDLTGGALITINPRPTAHVTGTNTICNGQSTTINATLTGHGPWNVTWSSNGVVVATHSNLGAPTDSLIVSPIDTNPDLPASSLYTISALTDVTTGCTNNQPGDLTGGALVTINPRPSSDMILLGAAVNCSYNLSNITVRANLHGLGPWQVTWSDGTPGIATNNYADYPHNQLTNIYADVITNFTLRVTNLVDARCVASANDLTGSVSVVVYPVPSTLVTGSGTICNGQRAGVQAALHGIGGAPGVTWSVAWSDGTKQINVPGPAAVYPKLLINTNLNAATNFTLWVTNLDDNGIGCTTSSTNYLLGSATVTVNPRPTASLFTSNTIVMCNDGSSFWFTNTLTGRLGPWTVWWNDGTIQTNTSSAAGPVTLGRQVFPINATNPNGPVTNLYYITNVVDADSCSTNYPGDILGTNIVVVYPNLAITTSPTNEAVCQNDTATFAVVATGADLSYQWYKGIAPLPGKTDATLVLAHVNNQDQSAYSIVISNHCGGLVTNTANLIVKGIVVDAGPTNTAVCQGGSVTFAVVASGSDLTYQWSKDGSSLTGQTGSTLLLSSVATNAAGLYSVTLNSSCGLPVTTNATLTVYPAPAPTNAFSQFGCIGVTNPTLSVSLVQPTDTAHWYDAASNLVYALGPNYTPTNTAAFTNTSAVTFRYFVAEVNSQGCESPSRIEVDLVLQPCTNQLMILRSGPNVELQWFGNYVLQHTTNLVPASWSYLTQGVGGIMNTSVIPIIPTPTNDEFFRLYGPTN